MIDLTTVKKNKINLADYNSQLDIQTRSLLSDFTLFDLEVLEEILFSPLKTSVKKLSRSLDCSDSDLDSILSRLETSQLLERQGETLIVDKDRRKYFEYQMSRFEENFKPDMEFIQTMLKQVPIHILPIWYSIPRSSNNIFESIVEKYLISPQVYQRYLMELSFSEPILSSILHDVHTAEDFKVSSTDLIEKYNLARADFDRIMLLLEYHFICYISYQREEDHWHEVVTPFHEWREYSLYLKDTTASPILESELIHSQRPSQFSFVEDMGSILKIAKKKPIVIERNKSEDTLTLSAALIQSLGREIGLEIETPEEIRFAQTYLLRIIDKLLMIKLGDIIDGKLYALETANDWLDLSLETRAIHLYRHPLNQFVNSSLPLALCNERAIKEAEKSVKRVLQTGWVAFDEFIPGVHVPINDHTALILKKTGKHWKYAIPEYSDDEKALIKSTVLEWLFECGITMPGVYEEKACFTVTPFGRIFFAD